MNTSSKFLETRPSERIMMVGHRAYVGGQDPELWYGIGKLQYHFLIARGLQPHHKFLDIACGSLRLGQFVIPYLKKRHYFGLEGEEAAVKAGLEQEFFSGLIEQKEPRSSFNYDFDFSFVDSFDMAMAQSLFTHLVIEEISRCFHRLRSIASQQSSFYFTFFEGSASDNPAGPSHDQRVGFYEFNQIAQEAEIAGWKTEYIGDWEHPRGQKIALATPVA